MLDGFDLIEVYDSWLSALDGGVWLSSADVDGDEYVSITDICAVEEAIVEQ